MANKLERHISCVCGYVSDEVEPYIIAGTDVCWMFLALDILNIHDSSMFANDYHIKVIACPKCKTMRVL